MEKTFWSLEAQMMTEKPEFIEAYRKIAEAVSQLKQLGIPAQVTINVPGAEVKIR